MTTATAKQEVEQMLQQLPEDATLEDIQYHVYVLEKIRRGRADIAAGRSKTTVEARDRLSRWLDH
jgi:predicted transcriptional regulator